MERQYQILACCRVSIHESDIFRFWIEHYRPHVDKIAAVIVAEPEDDTNALEALCRKADASYRVWKTEHFNPDNSMIALEEFIHDIPADWIIHTDTDEFLYEVKDIRSVISEIERIGADHAIARMIDRLAFGGRLRDMSDLENLSDLEAAFPVRAAITEGLAKACAHKVCVSRWPSPGKMHHPGNNLQREATTHLTLEHFKWRSGLEQRLRKRIKNHAASGLPWGVESERILKELATHGRVRAECWLAPRSRRIHGWMDYEDIYLDAVKAAPENAHFVEIGVWQGRSLCFLVEAALAIGKSLRIDGIDTFRNFDKGKVGYPPILRQKVIHHSWLDLVAENLRREGTLDYVNLIQVPSPEAARLYDDDSIRFIWIDGDHSYHSVFRDLRAWWPKVQRGGCLGGHDYDQPAVRQAVADSKLSNLPIKQHGRAFLAYKD
jgi:hypothetical protein